MVKLGYFDDLFLREFVDKDVRRSPSINRFERRIFYIYLFFHFRGYYIRMKALEYAFNMFYTVYDQKEVQVNLFSYLDSFEFSLPGRISWIRLNRKFAFGNLIWYELSSFLMKILKT
jgi:hypothetical protein